jgi:tRNA_anti-like
MMRLYAILTAAAAICSFGCSGSDSSDSRFGPISEQEAQQPTRPSPPPPPPPERKEWTPPPRGEPAETIDAADLWKAYGDNRVQADIRFKDKWLLVKGVGDLMRDIDDRDYVALLKPTLPANPITVKERKWLKQGAPASVLGFIRPGSEKPFVKVKAGTRIDVVGWCQGRRDDDRVWKNYTVELLYCELLAE